MCRNLGSAEAEFAAVAVKAECTQRNWAMWIMTIREREVILCLEGRESALLGYPEESRYSIQGRYWTEYETQLPHADCTGQSLPARFHRNFPLPVGAKITDFLTASSFTLSRGG